jgi:hypothetical protein
VIPKGRGLLYSIWRSCERFGVKPPGLAKTWNECTGPIQSYLLAYEQIRETEEVSQ